MYSTSVWGRGGGGEGGVYHTYDCFNVLDYQSHLCQTFSFVLFSLFSRPLSELD